MSQKKIGKVPAATGALRIFVYGTLKNGYWNHDRFCGGALYIEEAAVRGRLYELPSRIPVLQVPVSSIIAVGTSDPLADVATQERFSVERADDSIRENACWQMIQGELMTFPDPHLSLPPIDRLEGSIPVCPECTAACSSRSRSMMAGELSRGAMWEARVCCRARSQPERPAGADRRHMWMPQPERKQAVACH